MALYKLEDLIIGKPIYGAQQKALEIGNYKYIRQTDLPNVDFNELKYVNTSENKFLNRNDFIISRAGTIESYIHENDEKVVFAGYLVKYPLNTNIVLPKFLYLWTKTWYAKKQINNFANSGSTMPKLNPPDAKKLIINLPNLNKQKQIIDIIEPYEKLLLKHSQLLKINDIKSAKKCVKNIIDIIEPLETLQNKINILIKNHTNIINKIEISKTNHNIKMHIKTGKSNNNVVDIDGKFPFFSCSEKIKICNNWKYEGQYILLSGNAHLYVWWINGKFDAYQRVYIIKPKSNFFTSYYSISKAIEKLRIQSAGSVIKYLKLGQVKNIKQYDTIYEKQLANIYKLIEKLNFLNKKISNIKSKTLKLLI